PRESCTNARRVKNHSKRCSPGFLSVESRPLSVYQQERHHLILPVGWNRHHIRSHPTVRRAVSPQDPLRPIYSDSVLSLLLSPVHGATRGVSASQGVPPCSRFSAMLG